MASLPPTTANNRPQIWVVVAAFNEGTRVACTLKKMCGELAEAETNPANGPAEYHVVVIDDGSRDHTAEIAFQFPVWVLRHPVNCGQGAALRTGIEFALARGADCIVTFDGDGQHRASEIQRLVNPVLAGRCDVSLGSRFLGQTENMPLSRRILLWAAVWFTRMTTGLRVTDAHNGFRCFSRKAASEIRIKQPRMAHASEILDQISLRGLIFEEVPVTIHYTKDSLEKGQSSLDAARITGELVLGRFVQ